MGKHIDINMFGTMPRIGCDESGKGDYFGGITIAGVFLNEELEQKIKKLNIKDSKKLSSGRIYSSARELRKSVPHYIVRIYPEKYNQLYDKMRNINKILAWAHATVIKNIITRTKAEIAIVDKFTVKGHIRENLTGVETPLEIFEFPNAEQDLAVAASSILAREAFLNMIERLKRDHHLEKLPLGSSHIKDIARDIVKEKGFDILRKIAKLHFKTTKEFQNLSLF